MNPDAKAIIALIRAALADLEAQLEAENTDEEAQ